MVRQWIATPPITGLIPVLASNYGAGGLIREDAAVTGGDAGSNPAPIPIGESLNGVWSNGKTMNFGFINLGSIPSIPSNFEPYIQTKTMI